MEKWRNVVKRRRVGLLGGTFDPPHLGHLVVADQAFDQLNLDEVRLLVAKDPWQKTQAASGRTVTHEDQRLELTKAAVAGHAGLEVSDVEFHIEGPTYTTETLRVLSAQEPDTQWFLIVGSDTAAGLMTWHEPEQLAAQCTIALVNRLGSNGTAPDIFDIERVAIPGLEISSTDMRARLAAGRSVRFFVPDAVIDLCTQKSIYRQSA